MSAAGSAIETEVLIVGGGGAGCSTALHLARRGVRCIVLERGLVGGQASGVNYGGVRQQGRDEVELPLARRSLGIWMRLRELIGTDAEFEVTGHLKLARSAEEEAELTAYLEVARRYDLPLRMLGRNSLHHEYPWLGPDVVAGSLAPEDGAANPRLLAPAVARAARDAGAVIHERAEVAGVARTDKGFEVSVGEQRFRSSWLINTAGYWGGRIAEMFGEPVPIGAHSPNIMVTEPIPYFIVPNLGVVGGNVYLRQIKRGNVILGGGVAESDPAIPWARPNPDRSLETMGYAVQLVPNLAGVPIIRSWSGIDGKMPDKIPVLGPSATTPGLIHAFGFSGHGFQLGLGVGSVVAELVIDGRTEIPIAAFDIRRWTSSGKEGAGRISEP